MREFHKPVHRPGEFLETLVGSGDPSESFAHDSAAAFLHRVRAAQDPDMAQRIVAYANEHGIDDVAELWADAEPVSLPGALWRVHLIRHVVSQDPEAAGYRFRRGLEHGPDAQAAVVGTPDAPSPEQVLALADEILRGAFTGDFAVALERAAAFSAIQAEGARSLDDDRLTASWQAFATELAESARRWRHDVLV